MTQAENFRFNFVKNFSKKMCGSRVSETLEFEKENTVSIRDEKSIIYLNNLGVLKYVVFNYFL